MLATQAHIKIKSFDLVLLLYFISGLSLEQFVKQMSTKLAAVDTDDEIRQVFMAFDTTCK